MSDIIKDGIRRFYELQDIFSIWDGEFISEVYKEKEKISIGADSKEFIRTLIFSLYMVSDKDVVGEINHLYKDEHLSWKETWMKLIGFLTHIYDEYDQEHFAHSCVLQHFTKESTRMLLSKIFKNEFYHLMRLNNISLFNTKVVEFRFGENYKNLYLFLEWNIFGVKIRQGRTFMFPKFMGSKFIPHSTQMFNETTREFEIVLDFDEVIMKVHQCLLSK